MTIIESSTGYSHQVTIEPVLPEDFNRITKTRYHFDWSSESDYDVFKLCPVYTTDILGLISVESIDDEFRNHIRLISKSKENVGTSAQFIYIAENLIKYVAEDALFRYGEMAAVSLIPKTALVQHYCQKYGFKQTGISLSLGLPEILNLINA